MSIVTIAASQTRLKAPPKPLVSRDCGPDGCEIDWLASPRHEADLDIENFTAFAMEQGWGDGLPMVPPTETRVRTFLSLNNRYPDEVIAHLPPMRAECTVEKIVINAVMAGAPPESLPLLIAAQIEGQRAGIGVQPGVAQRLLQGRGVILEQLQGFRPVSGHGGLHLAVLQFQLHFNAAQIIRVELHIDGAGPFLDALGDLDGNLFRRSRHVRGTRRSGGGGFLGLAGRLWAAGRAETGLRHRVGLAAFGGGRFTNGFHP